MPLRSFKYRLYPTKAQVAVFDGMLGAFCDLYNAGLQQRIEAYRRQGKTLRYANQANELKAVRLADERLAGFSYSAEQQVLRRLEKAFAAFFRRLKTKAKAGFPRFRAKDRYHAAEFRVGDGLTIRKSGRIGIVGIPGEIKIKWHRPMPLGSKVGAAILWAPHEVVLQRKHRPRILGIAGGTHANNYICDRYIPQGSSPFGRPAFFHRLKAAVLSQRP